MTQDIKEALEALSLGDYGLTQEFAKQFTTNMKNFELLPATTRKKITDQYGAIAFSLSCDEGIARKHDEDKRIRLVQWLKGVNLLLAMSKPSKAS